MLNPSARPFPLCTTEPLEPPCSAPSTSKFRSDNPSQPPHHEAHLQRTEWPRFERTSSRRVWVTTPATHTRSRTRQSDTPIDQMSIGQFRYCVRYGSCPWCTNHLECPFDSLGSRLTSKVDVGDRTIGISCFDVRHFTPPGEPHRMGL